ncbi:MAG: hypothetical protein ACRYF3_16645 [Janthinobacterium lividum]
MYPAPLPVRSPPPRPPRPAPTPPRPALAAPAGAAPVAVVGQPRESEARIVLDADEPTRTVAAAQRRGGTLRVTLEWERQRTSSGLHRSSDVHLGCLWETRARHSGAVQSLGELLAAPGYGAHQVLRLGTRSEDGGEQILVDAKHLDVLRRMVLYVYAVGAAAPDYTALAPRLSIGRRGGGTLEVWSSEPPEGARTCAIASIHNVAGDLVVRRENEFFLGPQRDVALAYGFDDFEWGGDGTVPRHT